MTRAEGQQRREYLQKRIQEIENQLLANDVSSGSYSSGGGSKGYTNRSVDDLERKIAFARRELARIEAKLGLRGSPDSIVHVKPRFV